MNKTNWWVTEETGIPENSKIILYKDNSIIPNDFTGVVKYENNHVSYFECGKPKYDLHLNLEDWWVKFATPLFNNGKQINKLRKEKEWKITDNDLPEKYSGAVLAGEDDVILFNDGCPVKWIARHYIDDPLYPGVKHESIICLAK